MKLRERRTSVDRACQSFRGSGGSQYHGGGCCTQVSTSKQKENYIGE